MTKLISVIIPAYNQAKFLPAALDAVLFQTYKNWEAIIINDGSPDNTREIGLDYCAKDPRFKYLEKENGGLASARNAGLALASGELIQFLDSDDYIGPEKFQLSIDIIADDPLIDIVVTNFKMFISNPTDSTIAFCELKQDHLTFENVLFGWDVNFNIPIHSGLFKTTLFTVDPFIEHLKVGEDWVMWLSIFINNPRAIYSNQPMAYYRINPASMTKDPVFLRNGLIETYKYLISTLPVQYIEQFTAAILDRLNDIISCYEKDIKILRGKLYFKVEKGAKDFLRRFKIKKRKGK